MFKKTEKGKSCQMSLFSQFGLFQARNQKKTLVRISKVNIYFSKNINKNTENAVK